MTESCKISELLPNPYNRELDPEKVANIKAEIQRTGEIRPLVYSEVDNNGKPGKMVTDGHHRFQALKDLGYTDVPVVLSDKRGLDTKAPKTEVEKRRSSAGLNNAKEGSSWIRHEDNWVLYTGDNRKVGESETLDGIRTQQRMLDYVEDIQVSDEDVEKVVRHEGSKWVVRSHKGKSLGSYSSKEGAVNRLRQVEYFKHNKMSQDEFKEEVKDLAKAWFGEPERHAEVAAGHGTGLAGSQSKAALHTNLKNAIAVVAGGAILAGGIIALRNPAVLASIANAAKYALGKFPASKVATEAYDATVAAGGHTVSLAGKIPEARYMFSPYKVNERIIPMKNLAASHIDSYIRDNKALLSQPNHHLGTWHNTETGNVHLDVSLPHSDRTAALLDAKKHEQLAIYDRLHNRDIPVNETSIAQAKMIDSLKQTIKEKRENWHSGVINTGFGHDALHEISLATKSHADAHELKILYNHKNGNFVVGSPFWSHDQLFDAVAPAGKLDAPWIRMSYDTLPKNPTGHLNLWDWYTHAEQEKGSPGEHYAKAFARVLQNKEFPEHMTLNYHEPFRQLMSSKTLKEWRASYGATTKDTETGDIMKAEKEIDREAMVAAERSEHPTLEDKIVQQIAADHIKAGKDLLYKMGVEAAQKSVTRHPRPVPVNEATPAIPKDATHPKVLYTVTLPAKMTKQEVLARVQDLVKVYRGLPKETDAQANTQASIEQMQTIDQTLVDMHGSIQELEALARDQQLLSDEEVNLIIQPLKDKISLLLNVLENGTLEESEEVSQNTPEDSAIASDPQRQRKKPYGPKRVGDATAERELTEPATTFADKADSEQDISKGFFGFGGGNRGWHGDPEGHAEAARERWEVAGRGKPGEGKPGIHGAIKEVAVKAARHTGNRIARVAGEAIADIGLATFGAVAGVMILSHLKGTPIPMIQAGKLGLTHLKAALETSFKAAQITSLKNEVKLARLKLWLNNPGAKLSSGVAEAAKIAAEAKAASKPIQIIKPVGEKFSTIKPSIKTKPKNKIK